MCVSEVSGQARLRRDCSYGQSKHIQTAAHSAKEAESGDSRGTDYADATPAAEYSGKPQNGKHYFVLGSAITLRAAIETTAETLRRRELPGRIGVDRCVRYSREFCSRFTEVARSANGGQSG